MTFWTSELGEVTGSASDAFTKTFKLIPDGTLSLAKIDGITLQTHPITNYKYYNIDWAIVSDEFKGRKISQKIKAFDADPKAKHRALNMLKLVYQLFNIKPSHSEAPTDKDLLIFVGKIAGIQIRETEPNDQGKQYNWVSEVHSSQGFKPETGVKFVVTQKIERDLSSAFSRERDRIKDTEMSGDDIPF